MEEIKSATPHAGMGKPLFKDEQPVRMSRSGGKGDKGNGNSLPPNTATYGLGLGTEPNRMSRHPKPSKVKGNGMKLSLTGPGRMPRSDKGSASHDSPDYGIGGVSGEGGTGYGVGGKG